MTSSRPPAYDDLRDGVDAEYPNKALTGAA